MARYWRATSFDGFYVEGRNLEQTLVDTLAQALDGHASEPVMGAGTYIRLKGDQSPSLRVKDLADRSLIELIPPVRPIIPGKSKHPESEAGTETSGSEEEETGAVPPAEPEDPLDQWRTRIGEVLGNTYTQVDTTPAELLPKIDLKMSKWKRPEPMAIVEGGGEAIEVSGEISTRRKRGGGGGLGSILAMVVSIGVLAAAGYYLMTTATNDPYYLFSPGQPYLHIESALSYRIPVDNDLLIINVPSRIDTLWGPSPRFVRALEDTQRVLTFQAAGIEDLRVDGERSPSVILEPVTTVTTTTANRLDLASLTWNQAEQWQNWFAAEINRGLVEGYLARREGALWLRAGENQIRLQLSELLSPAELIKLRWAEDNDLPVRLEIRFIETLPINTERTLFSGRLFVAEVRMAELME